MVTATSDGLDGTSMAATSSLARTARLTLTAMLPLTCSAPTMTHLSARSCELHQHVASQRSRSAGHRGASNACAAESSVKFHTPTQPVTTRIGCGVSVG